jgi:hypothetical protein
MNITNIKRFKSQKDIDDGFSRYIANLELQARLEQNNQALLKGKEPVIPLPVPDQRTLAQRRADTIQQRAKATQNVLSLNIDKQEVNTIMNRLTDDEILNLNQIFPVLKKEISKFEDIDADFFLNFLSNLLQNLQGSDYQLGMVNYNPLKTEEIEFDDDLYQMIENSISELKEGLDEAEAGAGGVENMTEYLSTLLADSNPDNILFRFIFEYASTKKHNRRDIQIYSELFRISERMNLLLERPDDGLDDYKNMSQIEIDNAIPQLSNILAFIRLLDLISDLGTRRGKILFDKIFNYLNIGRSIGIGQQHARARDEEEVGGDEEEVGGDEEEVGGDEEDEEEVGGDEEDEEDEEEYGQTYWDFFNPFQIGGQGLNFVKVKKQRKNNMTTPKIIFGSGLGLVQEQPKYIPFGKYIINNQDLKNNILNIKYKSMGIIPDLNKKIKISDDLKDIIEEICSTNNLSKVLYKKLSEKDRKILDIILTKSGLNEKYGLKPVITQPKNEDIENMIKRYEIVKGQYMAGNNNDLVKSELSQLLIKFMEFGMITESEGKDILKDLIKK